MQLFGILGLIGSGKDTIGEYLVNKYGFTHDNLARPLKDSASAVFGWDRLLLEGKTAESRRWRDEPDLWWEKELDWKNHRLSKLFPRFTPRVCLQLFGTEVIRSGFHTDIWILSLKNRLLAAARDTVITDCRFPNECKAITDLGGKLIRVQRGHQPPWVNKIKEEIAINPNWQETCMAYAASYGIHASEWMSFSCDEDFLIVNNGTLDELYRQVDAALVPAYVV
jgi:hypothetical protein